MAVAVKRVTTKVKPKPAAPKVPRKSNASKLSEEKHIGSLTTDWSVFSSYEEAKWVIYDSLRHLNYFYDSKDSKKWAVAYAKKFLPTIAKFVDQADDNDISSSIGNQCRLIADGAPFLPSQVERVNDTLKEAASKAQLKTKVVVSTTVSPVERLRNKTSEFIANIEEVIDLFLKGVWVDSENYSVYNELQKIVAAPATAKDVIDYYTPLKVEIALALSKKDPELTQAYKMSVKTLKDYQKLVDSIVADATRYLASKKATATRTRASTKMAKVQTSAQQVSKVKFAKESAEFKVTSVDPTQIIGAEKVVLFDTRYKSITLLTTTQASGFSITGTTIQGVTTSFKKKLRKPDLALALLLKASKTAVDGVFNKLTTKPAEGSGRMSEGTIILKVYK